VHLIAVLAGVALIIGMLWDAFETIVLPRRVVRHVRVVLLVRVVWRWWRAAFGRIQRAGRRETYLAFFAPLSTLLELAVWAIGLIVGFAMVYWGLGSQLTTPEQHAGFGVDSYCRGPGGRASCW
jgi:hypothetical protein